MTDPFIEYLTNTCLYQDVKILPDGRYTAIAPFIYTHAIVLIAAGDRFSYEDRWCYNSYDDAKRAIDAWDGTGEPEGWHRHPDSGRRIGKDGEKYVHH